MHYSISAEALINRVEKEALKNTHVHTHLHERSSHKRLPLQGTHKPLRECARKHQQIHKWMSNFERNRCEDKCKAPENGGECKGECAVVLITKPEELHAKIANRGEWRGKRTDSRSQTAATVQVEKDGGLRDLGRRKIENQLDPGCSPSVHLDLAYWSPEMFDYSRMCRPQRPQALPSPILSPSLKKNNFLGELEKRLQGLFHNIFLPFSTMWKLAPPLLINQLLFFFIIIIIISTH